MPRPPSRNLDPLLRAATEAGTPVRLFLGEDGQGFSSAVLGVDDGRLLLAPVRPAHGNVVLERLMGSVRIELMVSGMPHGATTRVCAVTGEGVLVALPDELERIQRRRYFRMRAPAGTTARVELADGVRVRELLDISGGGCAFVAQGGDEYLADGMAVAKVHFPLGEERRFVGQGVVRRASRRDGAWGREMVMGIEFVGLPARERYQLIAWVTEQERADLRARSLSTTRFVADVMVLFHEDANLVRLRTGAGLSPRSVRVVVFEDEPSMIPGATHPQLELRVAGEHLLRSSGRIERIDVVNGTSVATMAFTDLAGDARERLLDLLRR